MAQARPMRLTSDLVAKVHRIETDEGPAPDRVEMTDEDFLQTAAQLWTDFGKEPLRVFAYGSLIWKPEFESVEHVRGELSGWQRSFCLKIERWRGTRAQPGLMMALDHGGSCEGIVYTLPEGNELSQIDRLLQREMTYKPASNVPAVLEVVAGRERVRALAFIASDMGHSYQGSLSLEQVAQTLSRAAGHWGSGAEYLYNTVTHLEQLGIHDEHLWQLQERVAEIIMSEI